ncbi:MAG: HD-GYP domain-containing protein [Thermoleophilaceae bacterium]
MRHEHERWDGRGYPDGLFGEAIPLGSRIILVCDAYDAMLSDRPYRAALSSAQAREQLVRGAGTQFDERIVGVLVGLRERATGQPQHPRSALSDSSSSSQLRCTLASGRPKACSIAAAGSAAAPAEMRSMQARTPRSRSSRANTVPPRTSASFGAGGKPGAAPSRRRRATAGPRCGTWPAR